jgi:hypothetical protein
MNKNEDSIIAIANKTTVAGGAGATFFGVTANEFAALVGVAIALMSFVVSLYFQLRKDKRDKELYEAQLAQVKLRRSDSTIEDIKNREKMQ